MMLDTVAVSSLIGLILSTINLFILVKNLLSAGEKKIEERLVKSEKTLIDHDRRIQTVESELRHMPSKETTHQLERTMERILGRLDTMDERLKPIAATNHRLQEYLLEQVQK